MDQQTFNKCKAGKMKTHNCGVYRKHLNEHLCYKGVITKPHTYTNINLLCWYELLIKPDYE